MNRKQAARTLHNHRKCKKLKSSRMTRPACKLVDWSLHAHLPFPISVSYENIIVKLSVGGVNRWCVLCANIWTFGNEKGRAWLDQPASLQPGPDMRIYLFQYLQVTKIASNYLWLQCTVCRDYKQATRTLSKHSNFKKIFKSTCMTRPACSLVLICKLTFSNIY